MWIEDRDADRAASRQDGERRMGEPLPGEELDEV